MGYHPPPLSSTVASMDSEGEPARRAVTEELPEWAGEYPGWRFWRFGHSFYAWPLMTSPQVLFRETSGWPAIRARVDRYLNGK